VKLARSHRLLILGAIMFLALFVWARYRGRDGPWLFLLPLAIAGFTYLLMICELSRTPRISRPWIFAYIVLSFLWRVPFFLIPAGPRDDLHRYVWDGRMQRLGLNPYTAIPADPALALLHTPETRELNNPDVPSPYPAGAQLFFRAVTAIWESTVAFKLAFLACDLMIVFVLFSVLQQTGRAEHWVLAYAWHPLLATEVAGGGHLDVLGVLLLLLSLTALFRGWRAFAAVALGLAVAVKLLPVVVAPLFWRRIRMVHALLATLVVLLLYLPFLDPGSSPMRSLSTYIRRFRFNDPLFATIERWMSPQAAAGIAVIVGVSVAVWLRGRQETCSWEAWAWPMAMSLVFAPVVYPWYLLWLVPFLGARSTLPLTVWSLSILFTYFVWYLHGLGHPWKVPAWITFFEYGLVAASAAVALIQRALTTREAQSQPEVPYP
jgi:hypothetical protein